MLMWIDAKEWYRGEFYIDQMLSESFHLLQLKHSVVKDFCFKECDSVGIVGAILATGNCLLILELAKALHLATDIP